MVAVILWGVVALVGGLGIWLVLVGDIKVERIPAEDQEE